MEPGCGDSPWQPEWRKGKHLGFPSVGKWGYVIKQALSLFESSKLNELDFKNTLQCERFQRGLVGRLLPR